MAAFGNGHAKDVLSDVILLQAGANPNEFDSSMATPLMVAAENGHVDVIDLLLAGGAHAYTKVLHINCSSSSVFVLSHVAMYY